MSEGCEEYAVRTGKLHPAIVTVLEPFFTPYGYDTAKTVIKIVPAWFLNWRLVRAASAAMIWRGKIIMIRGALNRRGYVRHNIWDLANPHGMGTLAHEAYHIYQGSRPLTWGQRIGGWFKWLRAATSGSFHDTLDLEREARDFDARVKDVLKQHPERLAVFEGLRGANGDLPALDWPGDV